jgi:hypothetical protein
MIAVTTECEKGMYARCMSATLRTVDSVVVRSMPRELSATQANSIAWTETRSGAIGTEGKRRLTNSAVAAWSISKNPIGMYVVRVIQPLSFFGSSTEKSST